MANKRFEPTPLDRELVKALLVYGIPLASISRHVINPATGRAVSYAVLTRVFRKEIATSVDRANATVAANLYRIATAKNARPSTVQAGIFWMRTRGGWRLIDNGAPPAAVPLDAPPVVGTQERAQAIIDEVLTKYGRRRTG
jgi:hypothetical protein